MRKNRLRFNTATATAAMVMAGFVASPLAPVSAGLLDTFDAGEIIVDFQFDDASGTIIPSASNTGSAGGSFDADPDSATVVTNGLGLLDVSPKNNTSFGANYTDIDDIIEGRVIALFDVSWNFDELIYDSSQDEEFRLTLIRDDPRSNFVTAETFFRRTSATEVTLFGNGVGTGSSDTPDLVLGSSGSLLTLMEVDLDADVFELFYSADGGTSFLSAGTGTLDPTRGISSVRLVLNEDFSDDSFLIDRIAVSVVPEPSSIALVAAGLIGVGLRRRRHTA